VAWWIARAASDRPDFYVPFVRRIAETMSADDYYDVAEYPADHGHDAEAIATFEQYGRIARDRVSMSGRTKWFVVPMFRSGQRAIATQMARDAAEVYSYGGLVAYASVLDMSGETRQAETFYRQAVERYGSDHSEELAAFLMRHQSENASYARDARNCWLGSLRKDSSASPPRRSPVRPTAACGSARQAPVESRPACMSATSSSRLTASVCAISTNTSS
jgi:hypothetical protein